MSSFRRGNIAHLILDREHALTALTSTMVERLHSALSSVRDDPEVDVLLLSGQGRAFCAGSDVKEMAARPLRHGLEGADLARARASERDRLQRAFDVVIRLHELEQPSVAALQGPVAGGGMGLALACDFRIASQGARLIPAYRRLGLPGDWGVSWFLTELAGRQYARRMLVGGSTLTAEEALAVGLVDEVVAEDELEAVCAARTDELAAGSSPATRPPGRPSGCCAAADFATRSSTSERRAKRPTVVNFINKSSVPSRTLKCMVANPLPRLVNRGPSRRTRHWITVPATTGRNQRASSSPRPPRP
ncbi:enoyl-CoA hydratase/isomerase family protein [Nocardioides carbamazepini]|uniref:enoyl-CoA hydratase/isomerase family protein n=1 Tax=Nocardioides carbamazepini TaxID=2854259 RepID=UPI00214A4655|nr:enoyl-CoA hydratase/isomerase family protein [Nocardioides carbamazepini]MCR1781850.1 enoyl-CoA hydratase/isomerase family protein [Nocardioides carbamazepini]